MSKTRGTDQSYLKSEQYHNANKLTARIRLHQDYGTASRGLWEWYFDHVATWLPAHGQVLEVGTGRGDMWYENRTRIPQDWDITLTDLSSGMIEDNRVHLGDLSARMTYRVADVMQLPFEDNSFDIVFANWMLYHVPNLAQGIAELRRVLKPDGVLMAGTNGDHHMREIYEIAGEIDDITDWVNHFSKTFSLQNGAQQLMQHFANVRRFDFASGLWVTEAQPIIDYIESMMGIDGDVIIRERGAAIQAQLEEQIAQDDGVRIGKESGLFIATGQS